MFLVTVIMPQNQLTQGATQRPQLTFKVNIYFSKPSIGGFSLPVGIAYFYYRAVTKRPNKTNSEIFYLWPSGKPHTSAVYFIGQVWENKPVAHLNSKCYKFSAKPASKVQTLRW